MDSREQDMDKYLSITGVEFEVKTLEEGDFTNDVDSFIVERKRGFDLLNSLLNKKIYNQLVRMVEKHPNALRYIIFEGDFQALVDSQTNSSLKALLISFKHTVCHLYGAQWIETCDKFHTSKELLYIDKYSRTVKDKPMWEPLHIAGNWDERIRVLMSMTPHLGQHGAENILEEFKSIDNYYSSCITDRKKILTMKGYGKTKLNNTLEIMQSTEPFIKKRNKKKTEKIDNKDQQANDKRKAYYAKRNGIYKKKSDYNSPRTFM